MWKVTVCDGGADRQENGRTDTVEEVAEGGVVGTVAPVVLVALHGAHEPKPSLTQ